MKSYHLKTLVSIATALLIIVLSSCGFNIDLPAENTSDPAPAPSAEDPVSGVPSFPNEEPSSLASSVCVYEYSIPSSQYSEGIYNTVRRARQMCEVEWLPLTDIVCWEEEFVFPSKTACYGIPYGQPVYAKYVPWNATLEEFASATARTASAFYTDRSTYNQTAPFYSSDCSAFVSWAWGLSSRTTTSYIEQYCSRVPVQSLNGMRVGDALNRTGPDAHIVLITGIKQDNSGNVTFVEISESTPPITRVTRYGEGQALSIDYFYEKYLGDGYSLIRYNQIDNVPYKHSCASPIDGETCSRCTENTNRYLLSADGSTVSGTVYSAKKVTGITYRVDRADYGFELWQTDGSNHNFRKTPGTDGEFICMLTDVQKLYVYETKSLSDGIWGKTRYEGTVGWCWLGVSERIAGTLEKGTEYNVENLLAKEPEGSFDYYGNKPTGFCFELSAEQLAYDDCIITVFAHTSDGAVYNIGKVRVLK